jgi:hypothetical protein
MNTRTKQEIKLKSGRIIPANSYACIECGAWDLSVYVDGKGFRLGYTKAHRYLNGFCKPPALKTLEKWSESGYSRTPAGNKVEEDGHDADGFPSWHMILGLV